MHDFKQSCEDTGGRVNPNRTSRRELAESCQAIAASLWHFSMQRLTLDLLTKPPNRQTKDSDLQTSVQTDRLRQTENMLTGAADWSGLCPVMPEVI